MLTRRLGWALSAACCVFLLQAEALGQQPRRGGVKKGEARSPAEAPAEAEAEGSSEEEKPEGGTEGTEPEPKLRAPSVEPLVVPDPESAAEEANEAEPREPAKTSVPPKVVAEDEKLMRRAERPTNDPTVLDRWTASAPIFTLHGYFRARGEFQHKFFLGRELEVPGRTGCSDSAEDTDPTTATACNSNQLRFANMRLRLEPTVTLSENVRVHFMVDAFDNLVWGSTPGDSAYGPASSGDLSRFPRDPSNPPELLTSTAVPPTAGRNSLQDSLVVRRAWAEVTNRSLGQLRFGRMGWNFGLGIFANDGAGIDGDFSSDVDRVMALTKWRDFYFAGMFDFASEGFIHQPFSDPAGLAFDAGQKDDVYQYTLAAARRMDEDKQQAALLAGRPVLNGGLQFLYRRQFLSSRGVANPYATRDQAAASSDGFFRTNAWAITPNLWGQFLWKTLRVEAEGVFVYGQIDDITTINPTRDYKLKQFGYALESEYRVLNEKLGIHFHTGYASGDPDVEGLSPRYNNLVDQPVEDGRADDTISTFAFHRNYRVDLILWRNIMGQVAGAYYFKPGVSYDLIRSQFGELLGARFDLIWSRASSPVQSYGSDADLGVELNFNIYYRSDDGPSFTDGFYTAFMYGILFPLAGLGYPTNEGTPTFAGGNPGLAKAHALRLILGVQF